MRLARGPRLKATAELRAVSPTCLVLRRLGFLALCLLAGALVGAGLGQLLGSVGQHAGSWLVGAEIGAVAGVWLGALRLG